MLRAGLISKQTSASERSSKIAARWSQDASVSPLHTQHPLTTLQRMVGNQTEPSPPEEQSPEAPAAPTKRPLWDFSGVPLYPRERRKAATQTPSAVASAPSRIGTELELGTVDDPLEREADRIADQAMRTDDQVAAPLVVGASGHPRRVAAKHAASRSIRGPRSGGPAPAIVREALASHGRPLDAASRTFFEERLGHDFSAVRLHADGFAANSAAAIGARAYTVGKHIVLGRDGAEPNLLGHELAHVVQQSAAPMPWVQRQTSLDIALRSPGVTEQIRGSELLDGFDLNSHTLTADHRRRLIALANKVKQLLGEHPLGTVEITGHTDATGDEAFNQQLGQDRADAVGAFLRGAGVPAVALLAQSAGESALRVPTQKPEPRNRRVEIRFLPELPTPSVPTTGPGTAEPKEKLAQIPRPENLCTEHPEVCDPITEKPEATPSCSSTNCSAVSGDSFDKQPSNLQLVLTKSLKTNAAAWFAQLEPERRFALTQIFNRMCQYGVWCHVRLVLKIEAGEAPLRLAGHQFPVFGSTPSVFFTSLSGDALIQALMATGKFCIAVGKGGSQHPGQTSLREVSGSDSLHISIGSHDTLDAHIDRYSPVPDPPGSAFCPNEPTPAAVGHIGRELIPGMVRQGPGTGAVIGGLAGLAGGGLPGALVGGLIGGGAGAGGFQVFPDPGPPVPQPPGSVGPEPFSTSPGFSLGGVYSLLLSALLASSRITVQGPLPQRPHPLVPSEAKSPSPDVAALEATVITPMTHELEQKVSGDALLPSRVRMRRSQTLRAREFAGPGEEEKARKAAEEAEAEASSYPDAHVLGIDLAGRMEQAAISGEATVRLPVGPIYGGLDDADRRFIAGEVRRIALIVRKHLPTRAAGVRSVVVVFGVGRGARSEVIDIAP